MKLENLASGNKELIMRTDTEILIKSMHILSNDVQSVDGVANAAISEAAYRLEELHNENKRLKNEIRMSTAVMCDQNYWTATEACDALTKHFGLAKESD